MTEGTPTSVLIASGDEGIRAQVALTLASDRFRVAHAEDTETALRAIAGDVPGLLVVDIDLAGAGALAIARAVRQQPETSGVRVLVLTNRDAAVAGDEPGVDATLAVPFTPFALLAKVQGLVDSTV